MRIKIKSAVVVAIVAISLSANAQGVQVGYINQTSTSTFNSIEASGSMDGVQAGLTYNLSVQSPISLQYGLLYSYLFKNSSTIISTSNTTAHQLDLPVRVVATFPLTSDLNAFGYAGPNFTYALANKTKTTVGSLSVTTDLYGDNSDYTQFNLQAGVGGGLSFKNIVLKVGYDWGLIDLNKSDNVSYKTNALTASVGVTF